MKLCKDCRHCMPDPFPMWNPRRISLWPLRIYRKPTLSAWRHATCALAPRPIITNPVNGEQGYENDSTSAHLHCTNLRAVGPENMWPINCGTEGKLWEAKA